MRKFASVVCAFLLVVSGAAAQPADDDTDYSSTSFEPRPIRDTAPPDYLENIQRFVAQAQELRATTGSVPKPNANYIRGVQWPTNVVTVAFNGGAEATRQAIEQTANEWTAHSGAHFRFQFRDRRGAFLTWSEQDAARAADIRIGFYSDHRGGYWSDVGLLATVRAHNEGTMNYEGMDGAVQQYAGDPAGWLASYEHSTILHEFGHALGLSHEHFHPQCQDDIIFDPQPGYQRRVDANGYLRPYRGISPGAILYYQSPILGWKEADAKFNVDAVNYYDSMLGYVTSKLGVSGTRQETPNIDRLSVMLYDMPDFVLASGAQSPCVYNGPQGRFAATLSVGDIAYFRAHYNRPLADRARWQQERRR